MAEDTPINDGEVYIGLAFSGGGMRASVFACGKTEELRAARFGGENGLLDHVRLVSGVSGGSVTAAQLGLHGPAGLQGKCARTEPDWLTATRHNPEATSAMRAHAGALESYADPEKVKYVKLLDGGVTDNFGTTELAVERARAEGTYAPMAPMRR